MTKLDSADTIRASDMWGPHSSWDREYDVAARIVELEYFWKAGAAPALFDALKLIQQNPNIPMPKWVLEGALSVVGDRIRNGFPKNGMRGKKSDEKKIYKTNITRYYRWREVEKARQFGENIEDSCTTAVKALKNTAFNGSSETMRKDHQKVTKELKDPKMACLYYSAMPETRDFTGTSFNKIDLKK